MSAERKLTDPPTNLKEAIDWVLRVSGRDGFGGDGTDLLATALTASFKKTPHGGNDDVKKILAAIEMDEQESKPTGPIKQLGDALQRFIGYGHKIDSPKGWKITQGGIVKPGSSYTSAYKGTWDADVYSNDYDGSKRRKGVQCFFIAVEKIFEGLTELYYNCRNGWKNENLGGSNLQQFMDRNGFRNTQLNTDMKGERIISQALKDLREFTTAYNSAGTNPSLDTFRYQLEQNAMLTPSNTPLSALYILATHVYVKSTSPATPSFAGYSGTAAQAGGAYGLNLGGLGTFMSAILA
ncbi:variant erythrocyte surface antigen-1 family protein [Babesia caballi]|nr:variant erythrocyte surface antigen-1 family protein [Babesia caballi]